ncbi:MAG: hypothetical protein A2441_00650 [Candidatus Veblenbacteria bacterium RIFOXYC2_FULL_42_11]|uniref:HTH arsR-type domain-containing protein n=2 Tax=Candidatus Vebleniibacteriota TaxID=1817921 RepID=A0A1G2Q406_9BACT|nr:MAG: Transcriptional regulator, ArsR family [Parcubacteria group bacterium GW2011_GWE2_43_12]OHA55306.1 MAG: hypothetical protein A2226_03715 [Candidatus Veblenbacteria bacterium RIFOXYA2_FULL_43_9]OHA57228.1 MAG: hypothetical protein A2441_00650 [Candidatus Veblenbacteria bacterium RIFOXYC2_FULL_42_11]
MFNKVLRQHAELLKVLANPKRLEVLYLLRQGELTVSDIELATGMRQANLSQHLMVLRNAGIVSSKHKGRKVYYHLKCPGLTNIPSNLFSLRMASSTTKTGTSGKQNSSFRSL